MSIMLVLAAIAAAQDGDVPRLNAQVFRPSIDAERTVWLDDARALPDGTGQARAWLQYANGLFIDRDPTVPDRFVSDVLQMDLAGGYTWNFLRVGANMPVYLYEAGTEAPRSAGFGDVSVEAKAVAVEGPTGLAVVGRLLLPTASVTAPLGADGAGGELVLVADHELGPVLLVANLGTRFVPEVTYADLTWTDAVLARLGAGWAIDGAGGVSAELATQASYDLVGNRAGVPIELMVGGWRDVMDGFVARGALATGLTGAVGAPRFRALLGVGYEPTGPRDRDLDGVADKHDPCMSDAEDLDGWADDDGCPDPSVVVSVAAHRDGAPVDDAEWTFVSDAGELRATGGDRTVDLPPGDWVVTVSAPGHVAQTREVFVPLAGAPPIDVALAAETGVVRVLAFDANGDRVPGALVQVSDGAPRPLGDGLLELPAGQYAVVVTAPGFVAAPGQVDVAPGAAGEVAVVLGSVATAPAPMASLDGDRITIHDKVYFALNEARLLPESTAVLTAVARVLAEHPEITKLRVEGHTDARGPAKFNAELSQDRAEAVRAFLISRGVDPSRLEAKGFGSSQPLVADPEAEQNRRVEFMLVDRRS
jgi:outer membrane protein OmpA-like peptidoglycan-associated protein